MMRRSTYWHAISLVFIGRCFFSLSLCMSPCAQTRIRSKKNMSCCYCASRDHDKKRKRKEIFIPVHWRRDADMFHHVTALAQRRNKNKQKGGKAAACARDCLFFLFFFLPRVAHTEGLQRAESCIDVTIGAPIDAH